MQEFLFIFRTSVDNQPQPSPEQLQARLKAWQDWMGGIAAQDKLASPGNRLYGTGNVVRHGNVVTNGPFVEIKEAVGGYIMVKADSLEAATALSAGCPIFSMNGNIEIRPVVPM